MKHDPVFTRNATFADTLVTRRADIRPETFNADDGTVEAVISTGADYPRRDARGPFTERLDLSAIHVTDLVGLPVLDGHRGTGSEHVIGTITSARRDGPGIAATIRLSEADDVRSAVTKVREGVLRGVSIGYRVTSWQDGTDERGGRVRTAMSWKIHEVSLVAIPADAGATVRGVETMPELNTDNADPRAYRTQVRNLVRSGGLPAELADELIDAEVDMNAVKARMLDELQKRAGPVLSIRAHGSNRDPAIEIEHRAEALACRMTGAAPSDGARRFMHDRLIDHVASGLERQGVSTRGMSPDMVLNRAFAPMTTSDFPLIAGAAVNKALLASYTAAVSPLKQIGRKATHPDFKGRNLIRVGELGELKPLSEAGEVKSIGRGEVGTSYTLGTYAGMVTLSRKLIINDDTGALSDMTNAAGQASAQTEASILAGLLLGNPAMYDGTALFHANHGNNAAVGAALSVETLSAARLAMRQQTGVDGVTPIAIRPAYLIVGPTLETDAEKVLTEIAAGTVDDVNPFSKKLQLLVEPRILDDSWFVAADPASVPTFEYAYLSGAEGPQVASREGWEVLGMQWRIILDFGAAAVDWRGVYRNVGA